MGKGYVQLVSFRCRPSTFRFICNKLVKKFGNEFVESLRKVHIDHLLYLPVLVQNIPFVHKLLTMWDMEKQGFIIKDKCLQFTSDEVALIIGLPNKGQHFELSGRVISRKSSNDIRKEIDELKPDTPMNEVLQKFFLFILSNLFFPYHNYKLLDSFEGICTSTSTFLSCNWPAAIRNSLVLEFDAIGRKVAKKTSLGYMNGFVPLLIIWFFEHTNVRPPSSNKARPRFLRWPGGMKFTELEVEKFFDSFDGSSVLPNFLDITSTEKMLLSTSSNDLNTLPMNQEQGDQPTHESSSSATPSCTAKGSRSPIHKRVSHKYISEWSSYDNALKQLRTENELLNARIITLESSNKTLAKRLSDVENQVLILAERDTSYATISAFCPEHQKHQVGELTKDGTARVMSPVAAEVEVMAMLEKLQQKYKRVKDEMVRWDQLQSQLLSQFENAASIITRLPVLKADKNYDALEVLPGIKEALIRKQIGMLEMIFISIEELMNEFQKIVLSLDKIVKDADLLLREATPRQMQLCVGIKPNLQQWLDGLNAFHEMYKSEFLLKSSIRSKLKDFKCSADDVATFRQLLVDQPNISKDEIQTIFDIVIPKVADDGLTVPNFLKS